MPRGDQIGDFIFLRALLGEPMDELLFFTEQRERLAFSPGGEESFAPGVNLTVGGHEPALEQLAVGLLLLQGVEQEDLLRAIGRTGSATD